MHPYMDTCYAECCVFDFCLIRLSCACFCSHGICCYSFGRQYNSFVQELTNDRLVSEADLARLLGTLRYLQGLKSARQKVEVGAADDAEAAEAAADQSAASINHGGPSQSSQIAFIPKCFQKNL